jgi:flagellar basal body-associated protein FliL
MNKKLLFPILTVVLVVIAAFAAYSMAKPKPKVKIKINGTVYILQKAFTLNLRGGQYATLTAALLLPPTQALGVTSPTNPPPTGFGSLTDEAVIRAIITNDVTDQPASALLSASGRAKIEAEILSNIKSQTDTKVTKIYFTDLAVQ